MSDRFDEWLDDHARGLKYQPQDPFVWSRIQARVQDRLTRPLTMTDVLFRWRRALALALATLALVSGLSIWKLSDALQPPSVESVVTADFAREDIYRVVP